MYRALKKVGVQAVQKRTFSSPKFNYAPLFQSVNEVNIPYKKISSDFVSTVDVNGQEYLKIEPEAFKLISEEAMYNIAHLLRPGHLQQLSNILKDPESTDNDRFVAKELLRNANISAAMVLPSCQDTGTAIILGKCGHQVLTDGQDEKNLAEGVFNTYTKRNLRYSQVAPMNMFTEKNTGSNLPAQVDLFRVAGNEYKFMFMAKGGGSANKTFLYQKTKALLNEKSMESFIRESIKSLGTSACPPYHLAFVVGGLSAEQNLKTVKLASARYLDDLPTEGSAEGRAFRDLEWEAKINKMCQETGIGAQFGGKYFCHDVRVIRLPRHGASCPVGLGVSCSADRQMLGKINKDGIFIEQLETDPAKYLPEVDTEELSQEVIELDLDMGMDKLRDELAKYSVKTRVSLTGTIIVARDIAHAKIQEKLDNGEGLPEYMKNYPVYYAGPAKTPEEELEGVKLASGSFGPTTAGRMDSYVSNFQANGGSYVMIAKGNRSKDVADACKKYKGTYLSSIGGAAAVLAKDSIKHIECIDFPELGMESVWKLRVEKFPAFIVIDAQGNDFFADLL